MTSQQNEQAMEKMLNDMVQDAGEYYSQLRSRHIADTRIDAFVVGVVVWLASFIALGVGTLFTINRTLQVDYLLASFLAAVTIGAVAGVAMYGVRRRRGFKFAELGSLVDKIKQGKATSEDGLRLMDVMHQAAIAVRKQRLDKAFEYGVAGFIVVSIIGLSAGFGALAGVVVYLYFRYEAIREFEREDEKYEVSKRDVLLSL